VAISVDSNAESHKLCQDQGYTFPFLSDPKADVIRRYGVLHAGAGENGRDIARPAEFLVDAAGTIRTVNLTDDIRVRARPEIVLREIDYLQRGAGVHACGGSPDPPHLPGLYESGRRLAILH
jgi:peroxiredoxin